MIHILIDAYTVEGTELSSDRIRDLAVLLADGARRDMELHLLVPDTMAQTLPELQRCFSDLVRTKRFHIGPALPAPNPTHMGGTWRKAVSAALHDALVAGLSPDVVLRLDVSGPTDDRFGIPVVGLLSKIPVRPPDCAHLLAPSEAARRVILSRTGYSETRVTTALPGPDPRFAPPDLSIGEMAAWRNRHGLDRPYILSRDAGSLALDAYAALSIDLRQQYDLVILQPPGPDAPPRLAPGRIRDLSMISDAERPILHALAELAIVPDSMNIRFAAETIQAGTPVLGALPEELRTDGMMSEMIVAGDLATAMREYLGAPGRLAELRAAQNTRASVLSDAGWAGVILKACLTVAPGVPTSQPDPERIEADLVDRIRSLPRDADISEYDFDRAAAAVDDTRRLLVRAYRPRHMPMTLSWQLEGPFDSSYSLAMVNRETAQALARGGVDVALVSAEGPGPFDPDPIVLAGNPDLARLHARARDPDRPPAFVTSRNMFPPRVHDIETPYALLHGYAWEETGLPTEFGHDFETYLDGALVTSEHVRRLFIDQGLSIPIHVVGNGVDHLDRVRPEPLSDSYWPEAAFRILHVSACFPRKGADALLEAFATAFDGARNVALLIKTYPNPHNTIHDQITDLRSRFPDCPPTRVLEDDLSPGQMRTLYAEADCLVVPSRAEGFCLPIAEAVLVGTPVITTGWSGQTTFAGNPLVSFCDYEFAPAESHLGAWDSVWAEPDRNDLANRLRTVRQDGPPDQKTAQQAAAALRAEYGWDQVARRSRDALSSIVDTPPCPPARIGWVSTYNTRCGIATYSAHLIDELPDQITVFAAHAVDCPGPDGARTIRCWSQGGLDNLTALDQAIQVADPEILVIQFNFGFYALPHLETLVLKARQDGRSVVVMMHATDDTGLPLTRRLTRLVRALKAASRVLVHSTHDLNRLKSVGVTHNVALFPHGVPTPPAPPTAPETTSTSLILASYGFMLPQKGLPELVDTLALLRHEGWDAQLRMINAEYPSPVSIWTKEAVMERIAAHGLDQHVMMSSDFLPDADSLAQLTAADLLVFPYRPTQESASGAVRLALAADRPIAVTPLPIFDDVAGLVTPLPGSAPEAMAEGLAEMAHAVKAGSPDHPVLHRQARARAWRDSHAYAALGPRLWRQLQAVRREDLHAAPP